MKKALCFILTVIMLAGLIPTAYAVSPVRVTVDSTDLSPFGAFEGWGTSLCWWAVQLGGETEPERRRLTKAFFDPDEGLGLNIVRYNIGAGDDPTHTHLNNGRGVPVWVSEDGTFNPEADPNQIAILQDAVYYGADIVECFSNSPPYYMTESGCSSGGIDKAKNNISPENFDKFAEYLADVTAYIQNDLGIKVASVEPMNEPATDYWGYEGSQEGCHIDPQDHSALILAVDKALKSRGLSNVAVAAADETSVDNMARYISDYSAEALAAVPRFNTHTYSASENGYRTLREKAAELGKKLYMTEVDGAYSTGHDAGSMGPALWLSQKINSDLNGLRPNAWVCWQITGPAYQGSSSDNGYWYMSQYDLETNQLDLFKKYYAFAQYTKFIRPGDYILMTDNENVIAARNFETGKTVIVVTNAGKRDESYEIDLSSFENLGGRITTYRTDKTRDLEKLENAAVIENKVLKATIPVNSITTFVIENDSPVTVSNMGLKLESSICSCFPGDQVSFTAKTQDGGKIVYSADKGSVTKDGVFTAADSGTAIVTASIEGTDISASKRIDVVDNGDIVRLVNLNSGLALQENGDEYVQYGDSDSAWQYWRIGRDGDTVTLSNLRSRQLLTDGDSAQWKLQPELGGYALVNVSTGKALDVYGNSRREGDKVGTYEFGGGSNQLWNFMRGDLEPAVDFLAENETDSRLIPTATEGTEPYGGSQEVTFDKAFDGDVTTHHDAWDGSKSYLVAHMPAGKSVTLIRYYPRYGFEGRMYGGKFYGVDAEGNETLLYTVPDKLKSGWNEAYIKNPVVYDKIIYRTPEWGMCNVAELEFYNIPYVARLNYDGRLKLNVESYTGDSRLKLITVYRRSGIMPKSETEEILVEGFSSASLEKELDTSWDEAYIFLMDGANIITSGYIYLKDIN